MYWKIRGRQIRGSGLANVLIVIAIIACLAFTVAGGSLQHLGFSNKQSNGAQAQQAAESAIALAVAKLFANPSFGGARADQDRVEYRQGEALGRLSFHSNKARNWRVNFSTNNLLNSNPATGYDPARPVPHASAQLVATGTYRGAQRRVEVVLYLPPFPYAIASAAPFRSNGRLEVGGIREGSPVSLDPKDLVAAHIVSNSTGDRSLVLGPESRVTGDVRSAGLAELDSGVYVGGEIRNHSDPVAIPKEHVMSYDPLVTKKPNLQILSPNPASPEQSPVLEGFVRCAGDLSVTGGLTLNNGVLYVDGNLKVSGGITGTGAVFVTKTTTVTGASSLATDNSVAVMSVGDVLLTGSDKATSFFQGMLYTEGNFRASQISLLGVFIQNGPQAEVEMSDANVIHVPDFATVDFQVASPTKATPALAGGNIYLAKDGDFFRGSKPDSDYGSSGPVVFEAYPVTSGGWEVVDPNTKSIHPAADYAAARALVIKFWNDAYNRSNSGGNYLLGVANKATGATQKYGISSAGEDKLGPVIDQELSRGNLPARSPGASLVLGQSSSGEGERFQLDPSRFLALKDQLRVLYWRAR